jgi:hypothetical protein
MAEIFPTPVLSGPSKKHVSQTVLFAFKNTVQNDILELPQTVMRFLLTQKKPGGLERIKGETLTSANIHQRHTLAVPAVKAFDADDEARTGLGTWVLLGFKTGHARSIHTGRLTGVSALTS